MRTQRCDTYTCCTLVLLIETTHAYLSVLLYTSYYLGSERVRPVDLTTVRVLVAT